MTAEDILNQVKEILTARGKNRDSKQERSMAKAVQIFNAVNDRDITEQEGWNFMLCLKLARSRQGNFRQDDYLDLVGYAALEAECAINQSN